MHIIRLIVSAFSWGHCTFRKYMNGVAFDSSPVMFQRMPWYSKAAALAGVLWCYLGYLVTPTTLAIFGAGWICGVACWWLVGR